MSVDGAGGSVIPRILLRRRARAATVNATGTEPGRLSINEPGEADATPILAVNNVSKHYAHVTALENVDLEIYAGEVLALLGDNGAGKTTLVSILSGFVQADRGSIYMDGEEIRFESPRRARAAGIATVFQDLALVNQRDVACNLYLGCEPRRWKIVVNRGKMLRDATRTIADLGVSLPSVRVRCGDLSGGQRQSVAIARTLLQGGRITILDEPTAALGVREGGRVLDLIVRLRDNGHAVVLISHNLETAFAVADRVAILRHGRLIAHMRTSEITKDRVVSLIVGATANG
jgi:D-xylose transport system ATP-binding protein